MESLPSIKDKMWAINMYCSFTATARTIQYLIGLKLCGIDCSDQDTGQATIVLKAFNLFYQEKETIVQGYVGWRKKSATASYNK